MVGAERRDHRKRQAVVLGDGSDDRSLSRTDHMQFGEQLDIGQHAIGFGEAAALGFKDAADRVAAATEDGVGDVKRNHGEAVVLEHVEDTQGIAGRIDDRHVCLPFQSWW